MGPIHRATATLDAPPQVVIRTAPNPPSPVAIVWAQNYPAGTALLGARTVLHLGFGFSGIDRRITVRSGRKSLFAMNRFRLNARGPIMRKISRSSRMRSRSGFMEL